MLKFKLGCYSRAGLVWGFAGPRKRVGLGEQELAIGRVLGWVKFLGFGLVRGGFQVWGLFFYLYSISKTNQTHLNSNWNLNSNHAQSIKSMH